MRSSFPLSDGGRSATDRRHPSYPSTSNHRSNFPSMHSPPPFNHRHTQNHYQYPNSTFPPNYRPDRTPTPENSAPGTRIRPNFIVQLVNGEVKQSYSVRDGEIKKLASLCEIPVESVRVPQFGCIAGSFGFRQWVDALSAVVAFWKYRLKGDHDFVPELIPNVIVPSDMDELRDELCELFSSHVIWLMENGDCVKKVKMEIDERRSKIESFSSKRGLKLEVFEKRKALEAEKDLVVKRLEEFEGAMESIVRFLKGGNGSESDDGDEEEDVAVFDLERPYDWRRIYSLIRRECRRLEDGLPIYAYRRSILKRIHGEQVYRKISNLTSDVW